MNQIYIYLTKLYPLSSFEDVVSPVRVAIAGVATALFSSKVEDNAAEFNKSDRVTVPKDLKPEVYQEQHEAVMKTLRSLAEYLFE